MASSRKKKKSNLRKGVRGTISTNATRHTNYVVLKGGDYEIK